MTRESTTGTAEHNLQGHWVVLREKRLEDAEDDYNWRCDQELASYDATFPLTLPFRQYLSSYKQEMRRDSRWVRRFAIDDLSGKHIGNCMYYGIDETRHQAELGILIGDRDYWGKGYGRDAVLTILRHIFQSTNIERVYLHTLDWNTRAQRCFQRCGFVAHGRVHRGSYEFVAMDIHKENWQRDQDLSASPSD